MPQHYSDGSEYLEEAVNAWTEFRRQDWRIYDKKPNDLKRLWAVALGSDWQGSGKDKMRRLLDYLPHAIQQASLIPAFSSRTTLWTILNSAAGVQRLAEGKTAATYSEVEQYKRQVLQVRLPEETILLLKGEAAKQGKLPSILVGEIIESAFQHPEP